MKRILNEPSMIFNPLMAETWKPNRKVPFNVEISGQKKTKFSGIFRSKKESEKEVAGKCLPPRREAKMMNYILFKRFQGWKKRKNSSCCFSIPNILLTKTQSTNSFIMRDPKVEMIYFSSNAVNNFVRASEKVKFFRSDESSFLRKVYHFYELSILSPYHPFIIVYIS